MQKWQADLWHSSISGKEKEPAANIIWLLVHHYVFLAATISLFSFPLIPPGVRHFTMEPTRRSISFPLRFSYWFLTFGIHFKDRKIICWVAWRHPGFAINRVLPPRTPRNTAKSKDYWVAQKFDHLIAAFPPKTLLLVRRLWLAVFLPMCRAVTARVALFLPDSERCTMSQVYRLVGPMWNNHNFPKIKKYRRVEMCAG